MKNFPTPIIDVKKYGGKQVALVKGKIIASGFSTKEVLQKAKKKTAREDHDQIWLLTVPKGLTVVYAL